MDNINTTASAYYNLNKNELDILIHQLKTKHGFEKLPSTLFSLEKGYLSETEVKHSLRVKISLLEAEIKGTEEHLASLRRLKEFAEENKLCLI